MTYVEKVQEIIEIDENIILFNDLDDALIGYTQGEYGEPVALYDEDIVIDLLMEDGMDKEEAIEHYNFNILGTKLGAYTPKFAVMFE